jgi:Leucine-rich repeat (LRR) protein
MNISRFNKHMFIPLHLKTSLNYSDQKSTKGLPKFSVLHHYQKGRINKTEDSLSSPQIHMELDINCQLICKMIAIKIIRAYHMKAYYLETVINMHLAL